ncbi:MAG: hypothetical protein ABEI77_05305 [Halorientalis sp.]
MIGSVNGIELKPRDGRVMDVVLSEWTMGRTPTSSEVLSEVSVLNDNKQVLRSFERLEDAGLVRLFDGEEYEGFEWGKHIPAPTIIEPTPEALNLEEELRVKPEEFAEAGQLSRQQLRRRVRELEETVDEMEETIEVLRGALGERKRMADQLADRVDDLEEQVSENKEELDHVKNALNDPEAYGIKHRFTDS